MPKAPSWYCRVPSILSRLHMPGTPPLLDRAAVEELFGVRRRQAIRLLNASQGYQVGKTFIVERLALIRFLERLEHTGAVREECTRKYRVSAALNEMANLAEAQRVEIRPSPGPVSGGAMHLSDAIVLVAPGRLQISYCGAEDLLARIVELAAAAANDFGAFRRIYGSEK